MEELYRDMLNKGLVKVGYSWLERAVDQHNPRVTLELANTYPVGILNQWEIYLLNMMNWN